MSGNGRNAQGPSHENGNRPWACPRCVKAMTWLGTDRSSAPAPSQGVCYHGMSLSRRAVKSKPATRILEAHLAGDQRASRDLLPVVYDELRALAARFIPRGDQGTLQPTALVHEAYLRLIDQTRTDWKGRTHFFAMAATSMRRVLVDHARARNCRKRGGGWKRADLSDSVAFFWQDTALVLEVHEALEDLALRNPRPARIVELRFFSGLDLQETALVLGIGRGVAEAEWRFARAWLNRRLARRPSAE